MMSDDLRRSFLDRAQALEASIRRLIQEILLRLPPEARREFRSRLGDRIELLFTGVEDAALFDPENDRFHRERRLTNLQELSDQLISARADFERERRKLQREQADLELEERRQNTQHLQDELEALDPKA